MISMFISSKSCSDIQSWKNAAETQRQDFTDTDGTVKHVCEPPTLGFEMFQRPVYVELHTQRRVHQDGVVKLGGSLRNVDRLHLLEAAQWVTLGHQF